MSSIIKCKECGGSNPVSIRICEFCGNLFIVEGKTLNDELEELKITFDKLKAFPSPGLLDSFKNNAKFSMPILTLVSIFLTYKINALFSVPGIIFLVATIRALFTKKQSILGDFKSNKLIFTAQLTSLFGLYGKDPSTNARLLQIEDEFKSLNGLYKKSKTFEFITYGILLTLFAGAYIIPASKTEAEMAKEIVATESSILSTVDSLLSEKNYDAANYLIKNLKSDEVIIELKSKIQFAQLESKIKSAEINLINSNFEAAKNELSSTLWKKNATNIDLEFIEEKYYKNYIQLKENMNERLPISYKVKVESDIDY